MDDMRAAAVGRNRDSLCFACQLLDPIGFDEGVDDEGASGLPLAIPAVATVDEHRFRFEPIAHLPAGAPAFESGFHRRTLNRSREVVAENEDYLRPPQTASKIGGSCYVS